MNMLKVKLVLGLLLGLTVAGAVAYSMTGPPAAEPFLGAW